MEYTFEQLKKMNVSELRDIAKDIDHEAVHGHSTMHKEHLVLALCAALGIDAHEHHEVVGINKTAIKKQIRELKTKRDEAIAAKDKKETKRIRREIHHLKNKMRRAMV